MLFSFVDIGFRIVSADTSDISEGTSTVMMNSSSTSVPYFDYPYADAATSSTDMSTSSVATASSSAGSATSTDTNTATSTNTATTSSSTTDNLNDQASSTASSTTASSTSNTASSTINTASSTDTTASSTTATSTNTTDTGAIGSTTASTTYSTADLQTLENQITALQQQVTQLQQYIQLLGQAIASLTGINPGQWNTGTSTATSISSTGSSTNMISQATIDPINYTVYGGGSVDLGGRGFRPDETVIISANGHTIATGHADGGGNFTTGSISLPNMKGTQAITYTGMTSGVTRTMTLSLQ